MKKLTAIEQKVATMKRGDELNGGLFVGCIAGRSSVWTWFPGTGMTFAEMCATFDQYYGVKP